MNSRRWFGFVVAVALSGAPGVWARDAWVYFGTFTNALSRGIYVAKLDGTTGALSAPELAAAVPNPNFLAVSPNGHWLYAATRAESTNGAVSVFAVDQHTGRLTLREQESSGGVGPCHVSVDAAGRVVLVANYNSGSLKSFHVAADGRLRAGTVVQHHGHSVNERRQAGPHVHAAVTAPGGQFVLACDLGTDEVRVYRINAADGALTPNEPAFAAVPPGSGPRHIAFSPDGKTAYVINEMACTVTVFAWQAATGTLALRQTLSLLPPGVKHADAFTGAEIIVRPDGRFIYASVRGLNRIAVLRVAPADGRLSWETDVDSGGEVPRGMGLDPSGRWLIVANQKSATVTVFRVAATSGHLEPTQQVRSVGAPVDVKFVPAM